MLEFLTCSHQQTLLDSGVRGFPCLRPLHSLFFCSVSVTFRKVCICWFHGQEKKKEKMRRGERERECVYGAFLSCLERLERHTRVIILSSNLFVWFITLFPDKQASCQHERQQSIKGWVHPSRRVKLRAKHHGHHWEHPRCSRGHLLQE